MTGLSLYTFLRILVFSEAPKKQRKGLLFLKSTHYVSKYYSGRGWRERLNLFEYLSHFDVHNSKRRRLTWELKDKSIFGIKK
jgi:hypothetical protein